jgi:hypothetical protein
MGWEWKMKRFVLGMGLLGLMVPGVASAALSLQMGPQVGSNSPANNDATLLPIVNAGQNFIDLIFHETGTPQPEGLFTYDIAVNLVRPAGQTGGISLNTAAPNSNGAGAIAQAPNPVFNTGSAPSMQITESSPTRLVFNVTSGGDLNDIDDGESAARIFYTVADGVNPGVYRLQFDAENSVFGSGDPTLPLSIDVALTDQGVLQIVPEPGTLSLLGVAGLLALRRRRTA